MIEKNEVKITKTEVSQDIQATIKANLEFAEKKRAKADAKRKAKATKPKKDYSSSNGNSIGNMFPQLKNLK